jgi:Predicted metal-binding, possibly nucleic acid-binding protein
LAFPINVSKALKDPGQTYPITAQVELEDMEFFGDTVSFSTVTVEGTMVGTYDTVNIEATARCEARSLCARCRESVSLPITAQIHALYAREPDPEDPDQYSFEAYTLDILDAARDAVVLELPFRFLCGEDCKGLCPKCGANLNAGPCTCQKGDDESNPFAALRSIVLNNEEV